MLSVMVLMKAYVSYCVYCVYCIVCTILHLVCSITVCVWYDMHRILCIVVYVLCRSVVWFVLYCFALYCVLCVLYGVPFLLFYVSYCMNHIVLFVW